MSQASTPKPGQIRHLLRVTNGTSRCPERDCLILLIGITTGLRVSEIAQIEVHDVLFPSGLIRQEVSLRDDHKRLSSTMHLFDALTNDSRP